MTFPPTLRARLAFWILATPVVLGSLLRVALYFGFHPGGFSPATLGACFSGGLLLDLLTACVLGALALAVLLFAPRALLVRRWTRATLVAAYAGALVFHAFVQWFFFDEFQARFNHVALDYLLYPTEVFGNIRESYDVPLFVALATAGGALVAFLAERSLRGLVPGSLRLGARLRALGGLVLLAGAGTLVLHFLPEEWREDRVENELLHNGTLSLVHAFATASLDWHAYYPTLPSDAARSRAASVLARGRLDDAAAPRAAREPSQVVVVLEESFGSEFVGVLGHPEKALTPEFDRWSARGLLLSNLVATGNRTVRGLEGVLASFVPLPGDSIVKRAKSEDVATLARVFRSRGFATGFFYGGYAVFDSMKSFLASNGWDEFVEQPDYPDEAFRTAWGVADRWIFEALLERQQRAKQSGEKLFATLLSVSNHKPYDVPPQSPVVQRVRKGRWRAVAYSDECIGAYLDALAARGLLDDTLVLVVGDHGARVYGSEAIPVESYRIPALFVAPDPRWQAQRIERLCSQIDLAPTLLALAGVGGPTPFLGTSVLDLPSEGGRAFVQHNRDVGMLTDTTLVVLGLQKHVEFYRRASRLSDSFELVREKDVSAAERELALDATAVFQNAYERYEAREYRCDTVTASSAHPSELREIDASPR